MGVYFHLQSPGFQSVLLVISLCLLLAFIPGAREEAPHSGLQHLYSPGPVPLPAAAHPGNATASHTQ